MPHRIDLPDWAIARGRGMNHFSDLDPAHTALVVIDMQALFIGPGEVFANPFAAEIIPAVNRVASALRQAGACVIWTRQTVTDDPPRAMPTWQYDLSIPSVRDAVQGLRAGTASHALHPDMAVDPADLVIDKYRYGAFTCPDGALRRILTERNIDTLVIAGTLTNCCCDSTARDGNMLGYRIFFLSDATAAPTDAEHNAALLLLCLNFADVRRTDALLALLEQRTDGS